MEGLQPRSATRIRIQRAARRVEVFAQRARLYAVPLHAGDGPEVADQLDGQLVSHVRGEKLCGLDLLGHDQRLVLGAAREPS
jgi:hypothetical protein